MNAHTPSLRWLPILGAVVIIAAFAACRISFSPDAETTPTSTPMPTATPTLVQPSPEVVDVTPTPTSTPTATATPQLSESPPAVVDVTPTSTPEPTPTATPMLPQASVETDREASNRTVQRHGWPKLGLTNTNWLSEAPLGEWHGVFYRR